MNPSLYKTMQLAILVALGSMLFILENFIPMPMPWMRLGLANVVTLLALYWWGMKEAALIVALRVILGGLLSGKFLTPAFVLAFSGGIVSFLAMAYALRFGSKIFGVIGISLWGAIFKNVTQLCLVGWVYIGNFNILALLPFILFSTLFSGLVTGYITFRLLSGAFHIRPASA